jgi:hypothetical protein
MSEIWTSCDGKARIARRNLEAWRIVEGQHRISTRKLVDTLDEQMLLEEILDRNKPPPPLEGFSHLHYLLYTPFRYPPLRYGSRFGSRAERSLWYGSLDVDTALAERAYYAFLFLEGTTAKLEPLTRDETAFTASIDTASFIDLTAPPFSAYEMQISAPHTYEMSQPLGTAMRAAAVRAFVYVSARANPRGLNIALFEPDFGCSAPLRYHGWKCMATRATTEFRDLSGRVLSFARSLFEKDGRLLRVGT